MKRSFIRRNFPPGYAYGGELRAIVIALVLGITISAGSFFSEFIHERRALYIHRGSDVFLNGSLDMPDFKIILGDKLLFIIIPAVFILFAATVIHLAYHYSGSKSIYLMRRLPQRFELLRRCVLIPLVCTAVYLLMAFILLLLFYAYYMSATPESCLTPNQWQKIWSVY